MENEPATVVYMDLKLDPHRDNTAIAIGTHSNIALTTCNTWGGLIEQLNNRDISLVIMNQKVFKEFNYSVVDATELINTLTRYSRESKKIQIAVCIEDTGCGADFIKELKSCNIAGIIPSPLRFPDLATESLIDLLSGTQHWPKEFLKQILNKQKKIKTNPNNPAEQLTSRQHQIYELIANRGLSNKQIANALKISESTVKIHVSAVMKAFCVRNRTQLALSAISQKNKI
jgi:DNA-binding NarL/FixJ family response regulator